MSEPSYADGEVVWVKWGTCWWPGEVYGMARIPQDILTTLKKNVIAVVKFFQEEAYEYVQNPNNIMRYNCQKKVDFIKKGMDKHKTGSKIMANFPIDVEKAERRTGGDVNIVKNVMTPVKQKASTSSIESSPAVSRKPAGAYNSSSKVQSTSSPSMKSDKKFTCTLCDYSTERINLLMLHIKSHSSTMPPRESTVVTIKRSLKTDLEASPVVVKKPVVGRSPAKKAIKEDTIADDLRIIKESMKEQKPTPSKRKARAPVKPIPATPTTSRSRGAKKDKEEKPIVKEEVQKVEEKPKPKQESELKTKLLADWDDDDDEIADTKPAKVEEVPVSPPPKPTPPPPAGEPSRSIRNIPKKQRISEVYIKQDPPKVVEPKKIEPVVEVKKVEPVVEPKKDEPIVEPKKVESVVQAAPAKPEEEPEAIASIEAAKKTQKANKRKHPPAEIAASEPEPKKVSEDASVADELLLASAELLNETEVPKVEIAQAPSTFHKSNDIDKRNLPPKERNKRIFRATKNNRESPPFDNNGSTVKEDEPVPIPSPIQNELMLPHKKKQSSRVLTPDKPENRSLATSEPRARKKRKSSSEQKPMETETNSHEPSKVELVQSPLREEPDEPLTTNSTQRRGTKRRISEDPHPTELDKCPEPKKPHMEPETQAKVVVAACASESICISSKGHISVSRKDALVTTQANSVMVTSHVIITEAMRQPIVSSAPSSEVAFTPKPQISSSLKAPLNKKAFKIPAEELLEMKKQGLVTVGTDNKNKFTEKGKQMYKQITEKTAEAAIEQVAQEPERTKSPELPSPATEEPEAVQETPVVASPIETVEEKLPEEQPAVKESNGSPAPEVESVDESTNNNDIEKETIVADEPSKESHDEPVENGKDNEEAPAEDPNSGGAGLIALQAETFGGPANCFYLCRQVDDRYEPVDNQILVLNAQNALVPYEGEIVSEDALTTNELASEGLAGYPQLSPNSNIIINTPNGQKIELNHYAIMALQEQADENGIASIELAGEQLELNIHGILEAISAQHESGEGDSLIPGAMLIDGESALVLDTSDTMPVEMHHSATQVSETLTKPIMSTTVAPEISTKATISEAVSKNLNIEDSLASIGVTAQQSRSNVPKSLELPITITNPQIAETVNHRKLANASILSEIVDVAVEPESFVVQVDNGSQD